MSEPDDKVQEGVEHLQNAALELIAAARCFLDVAEEMVRDPADLMARASAAAAMAKKPPRQHHDDGVERIRVV